MTEIRTEFQGGEGVWIGRLYCPIKGPDKNNNIRVQQQKYCPEVTERKKEQVAIRTVPTVMTASTASRA